MATFEELQEKWDKSKIMREIIRLREKREAATNPERKAKIQKQMDRLVEISKQLVI